MLLLDENLSPRLIARICQVFSGCVQVLHASLDNSPDIDIWHYAKEHNLIIVTKDKDFLHFANKHGFPPKLIYLNIGNAKLATVESSLIGHKVSIDAFRVQMFMTGETGPEHLSSE